MLERFSRLRHARRAAAEVVARVAAARDRQQQRFAALDAAITVNAAASGELLDKIAPLDAGGRKLLVEATEKMKLSARGYHRILRVARTLADLEGVDDIAPHHVAEAVGYRRFRPGQRIAA